ncbi:MAG: SPFH domain-containing protein [Candidatus Acidiferrales bacterium]
MDIDNIWVLLILAALALYVLAMFLRKTQRIFIPEYQRGVRFVKGSFANVLGPGSYRPFTANEQIVVVDMRPQPIILEKISYRDALQNQSFLSIGAEMQVCDAHLAATTLKDQITDSLPAVRDTLRQVVSRGIADRSPEFRSKTAADIMQAVNAELTRFGMKISNVEILELWSHPALGHTTTVSH